MEGKSQNAQEGAEQSVRYSDSIEAAAGVTGYAERFLQRVKAMGCPAFRGSRVYLDELQEYIDDNDLEELEDKVNAADEVDIAIKRERLRKLELANAIEAGKYFPKADLAAKALALGLELKAVLRKKLEEEYPDKQAGRTRDELLPINRKLVDEICQLMSRGFEGWSPTQ